MVAFDRVELAFDCKAPLCTFDRCHSRFVVLRNVWKADCNAHEERRNQRVVGVRVKHISHTVHTAVAQIQLGRLSVGDRSAGTTADNDVIGVDMLQAPRIITDGDRTICELETADCGGSAGGKDAGVGALDCIKVGRS